MNTEERRYYTVEDVREGLIQEMLGAYGRSSDYKLLKPPFFCAVAKRSPYRRTLQRGLNNLIELNLVRLKGAARQSNYELAK
jgi:hypothetical protein